MAAMLVRGKDDYGHFRSCRGPSGVMLPDDVAHWREIASARNSVMLAKTRRKTAAKTSQYQKSGFRQIFNRFGEVGGTPAQYS